MTERLRVGKFVPKTCPEILEEFDFVPDIAGRNRKWYKYCQIENGLTEYPTVEYVTGMARYLTSRIAELGITNRPPRILEVAAGRGLLSALISKVL